MGKRNVTIDSQVYTLGKTVLECPLCKGIFFQQAEARPIVQTIRALEPSPDKPPAVGDWIWSEGRPRQITEIRGPNSTLYCGSVGPYSRSNRVLRPKDAPLQKGDGGLLDGKIEVWVDDIICTDGTIRLVFSKETHIEFAYVNTSRFTLTEPVYDREGEKGGEESG